MSRLFRFKEREIAPVIGLADAIVDIVETGIPLLQMA
ncbi:MAG: hypothetical protein ACLTZB_03285 [Streptococcus salivarius]